MATLDTKKLLHMFIGLALIFKLSYCNAYYQNQRNTNLTCTSTKCVVICDAPQSCQDAIIDASQSDTLIIRCTDTLSCNNTKLIHGPLNSITIECTAHNSCWNASFQFNETTQASINCRNNHTINQWIGRYNGSCVNATFYGQNTEDIIVDCDGLDCAQAVFHVNSSKTAVFNMHNPANLLFTKTKIFGSHITNSLTVKCLHSESCRQNTVFCPHDADCNIYCRGSTDPDSMSSPCDDFHFFIPNVDYEHLYFNTTSSGALYHGDIFCEDSGLYSYIQYDFDRNRWKCRDFPTGCCPIMMTKDNDQSIHCEDGSECEVLCSPQAPCKQDVIYGGNAASLSVRCVGNSSCFGKNIICPHSSDTASCNILCDGTQACETSIIDVDDLHLLNISCTAERACYAQQIYPLRQYAYPQINTFLWYCSNNDSCGESLLGYGITVDMMDIQCTGFQSCKSMALSIDDEYTAAVSYPVVINTSIVIHCGESMACKDLKAKIISSINASNNIICENPSTSLDTKGACYRAHFHLSADYNIDTISHKRYASEWNLSCDTNDCQSALVSFDCQGSRDSCHGLNVTLYASCNAPGSCSGAIFQGQNAKAFHLQCKGDAACYQTIVRGPSYTELATNITCITETNAVVDEVGVCSEMRILSRWLYLNNYIQLNCESSDVSIAVCDGISFVCDQNTNNFRREEDPETTHLYYDKQDRYYRCQADNGSMVGYTQAQYCCPVVPFQPYSYHTTSTAKPTESVIVDATSTKWQLTEHSSIDDKDNKRQNDKDLSAILGAVAGIVFGVIIFAVIVWYLCKKEPKFGDKDLSLLHGDESDSSEDAPYVPPTAGNHVAVDKDTEMQLTSTQK